ncbi:membrane protein [Thermophagus xiamenensis]|uniref:GLPGLI family protein n=1 Tax=Thermophagus xiamenensis TaxID=385682 RepID=A0A1I1WPM0_9BACT|nr:membrane protein [Thermophagus xiamenensis]SFD95373.1 GLPGLI family protein [Thermophagus xiamenensis]
MQPLGKYKGLFILFILIIFGITITIQGCKSQKEKSSSSLIEEGIVYYTISYMPEIKERSFSFLLPDEMTYYFRRGQERITFKGNLGLYKLDFISNHSNDSSSTLLKIINKKMYVPASESQKLFIFQSLRNGNLTFAKDTTRQILGYKAQKAVIHLNSRINSDIEVWYSAQISNATTNKNTPFAQIPGVMLEFSIYYNDMRFNLNATKIEKAVLSDSLFTVPSDYQPTTLQEIEQTITGIFH